MSSSYIAPVCAAYYICNGKTRHVTGFFLKSLGAWGSLIRKLGHTPMASLGTLPVEVAQKCLEWLAFDEVINMKSFSRGLRAAARRALTRGRWRPVRFLSEHWLSTLRNLHGGLNSLDHGVAETFRAAWALDPGLVVRVIHEDIFDNSYRDAHQAIFLNIVEPSMEGIPRIIAACEGLYRELHGDYDQYDYPLFAPFTILQRWVSQLGLCSEFIIFNRVSLEEIDESLIGAGLESWADPKLAAQLMDEIYEYRTHRLVETAHTWSANWQDRDKARAFVAETEKIRNVHEEEERDMLGGGESEGNFSGDTGDY